MIDIDSIKHYLLDLQERICSEFISIDSNLVLKEDEWQRESGGGGRTRVLRQGKIFEQGGINFSHVYGSNLPSSATAHRPELSGRSFQALGNSLVVHPLNPYIPTTHMNIRFFIAEKDGEEPIWWLGGGFDLTPYYGFIEDAKHWHEVSKTACDGFGNDTYLKYKKWCDEYFYLKHRQEPRGIGGIFYDDLNEWGFESCFLFMQSVGENFLKAYLPIVERRRDITYSKKERDFQLYRRSRYAEFNLLYDRGTLFGLQSGGRIESILMSMPPLARWEYNWQPAAGSKEAELYDVFLKPKDWLAE